MHLVTRILLASVAMVSAGGALADQAPKPLRLYYSANRQGEADPCGCSVGQLGGLHRMRRFLAAEARTDSFFGDAGDAFFAAPQLNPGHRATDLLRAKLIADAYRKLGVDVLAPGERDFAEGVDTLRDLAKTAGVALVSANLDGPGPDGKRLFDGFKVIERGGKRVAFVGIADEEAFRPIAGVKVRPAEPSLKAAMEEARKEKPEVMVVLSHLGLKRDREIAAAVSGIDVIVGSHSLDALAQPVLVGGTMIVQPLPQGQQIGVLDLGPEPKHRAVDLTKELEAKNDVSQLMEKYRAEVRRLAVAEGDAALAPTASPKRPFVADPHRCRTCHKAQYEWWETTKHASAYLVLYAKNQHFDPDCIRCHSLGFDAPGGFSGIAHPMVIQPPPKIIKRGTTFVEELMQRVFKGDARAPLDSRTEPERYAKLKHRYHDEIHALEKAGRLKRNYIGVQCEHCHGLRAGHPGPGVVTVKKVKEESCRTCHTPPNDTTFNFTEMVKKVACPLAGHG